MKRVKEHLGTGLMCVLVFVVLLALDDSYEDSVLSAQVLDEAISQAYEEKELVAVN